MRKSFTIFVVLILFASLSFAVQTTGKIPITTSSEKAKEYYQKGLDFSDKLRAFDSLEYFHKAAAEDPQMALAFLYLAINAPTNKEFFENLDHAASLSAKISEGERIWIEAVRAGGSGQPAQQIELYKRLVTAYPGDERAHFLLGGAYFGVQDWNHAIEQYEKAVGINAK